MTYSNMVRASMMASVLLATGCFISGDDDDDGDKCVTDCDHAHGSCTADCDKSDNSCVVACDGDRDECTKECK